MPRFQLKNLDGFLVSYYNDGTGIHPDKDKYDYYFIDFDAFNVSATSYYALKSDHIDKSENVSVAFDSDSNTLTINGVNYSVEPNIYYTPTSYLNDDTFTDETEGRTFTYGHTLGKYFGSAKTYEELISELTATA